ncbi:MAG: ATP-dependent 6-phosphofructokinase [Leptospiraceae bacterium]|nr:ATP-dependent 6-phosphofructokinase [Leptospiraceae bacterium]
MKSTKIDTLGECTFPSPARYRNYIKEKTVVLYKAEFSSPEEFLEYHNMEPVYFEKSGPSEKIYFDPMWISCGIVTCGGLCPGINDVIRSIVMELTYRYGVRRILGFPFGYQGLVKKYGHKPIELTPNVVSHIHRDGGSFLSSSRGSQDISEMVDYLVEQGIKILFCIGGDGTLKGANAIYEEITRRDKKIAVIGIPKTIDNDINMISKTFGFSTAFSKSIDAIYAADVEANGAPNGIGLVKLMGRHSGYIAVNSALASKDANFVLIPEVDFDLEGEGAFLPTLKQRILSRGHAVIVIAEGAGQKFLQTDGNDPSGNKKLGDIGKFMRDKIIEYFHEKNIPVNLKYIDPSYIIRSMPANPEDSVYCGFLAQNAVHAGMAGKTGMVVGMWNNIYTNLPISLAVSERKVLRPETSDLWRTVLASTGQPDSMLSRASL